MMIDIHLCRHKNPEDEYTQEDKDAYREMVNAAFQYDFRGNSQGEYRVYTNDTMPEYLDLWLQKFEYPPGPPAVILTFPWRKKPGTHWLLLFAATMLPDKTVKEWEEKV